MIRFNSQREVVRQLVHSCFKAYSLHSHLVSLGIADGPLEVLGQQCAESAMDIVGFPVDNVLEEESVFDRSWLHDTIPVHIAADTLEEEVEKFVDFLYSEIEYLRQEKPDLFQ